MILLPVLTNVFGARGFEKRAMCASAERASHGIELVGRHTSDFLSIQRLPDEPETHNTVRPQKQSRDVLRSARARPEGKTSYVFATQEMSSVAENDTSHPNEARPPFVVLDFHAKNDQGYPRTG